MAAAARGAARPAAAAAAAPARGRAPLRPRAAANGAGAAAAPAPGMVVFDLDGLLWRPELYQMRMPLRRTKEGTVVDATGEELTLYPAARRVLAQLAFDARFENTKVAWASRTHQKKDATRAFDWFFVSEAEAPGSAGDSGDAASLALSEIAAHCQIASGTKQVHLTRLSEASGVPLSECVFLDNERWNITEVSKLGVISIYCPRGLTDAHWEEALYEYEKKVARRGGGGGGGGGGGSRKAGATVKRQKGRSRRR